MKVVILAGGRGTRLEEETTVIPKPLVRIGEYPMLWHIMKIYSTFGCQDFIICLGYKGYLIKEYFANYFLHQSDVTFDFTSGERKIEFTDKNVEPWRVTLVDTGSETQTGGRLKRIQKYVDGETFLMTYGDAVSDVNIKQLIEMHQAHNKLATVTAVQPPGRFGKIQLGADSSVKKFKEKPASDGGLINGGFFVLGPKVFDYLTDGDETIWEGDPMKNLVKDEQVDAYKHRGFWKCMDTLRDKNELVQLWESGSAPWKVWDILHKD